MQIRRPAAPASAGGVPRLFKLALGAGLLAAGAAAEASVTTAASSGCGGDFVEPAGAASMSGGEVFLRILACAVLLAFSALFSGLTLGLLGLDVNGLMIIQEGGSAKDRRHAAAILPVRKEGNLLLCTLLLGNVAVNSLSSIIMADLTSGLVGFLVSTVLIVLLGEIIPQAACSRHALRVGSTFVPLVKVIMFILYPFAKPVAALLDKWLGQEIGTYYSRKEFQQLLQMHVGHNMLDAREAAIMSGAIKIRETKARAVCTPLDKMFTVCASDRLDYHLLTELFRHGYSRVPVWDDARTNFIGVLYSKDLMLVEPSARTPVITVVHFFNRQQINVVDDEDTLEAVLKVFSSSRQHFAAVRSIDAGDGSRDPVYRIAGCITMEDVIEAVFQQDIIDEYDACHPQTAGTGKYRGERGGAGATEGEGASASAGAAGAPHATVDFGMGSEGVAGIKSGPRVARERAALRRLREVSSVVHSVHVAGEAGAGGPAALSLVPRGVNNDLSVQEIRGMAAHLVTNVKPFRPSVGGLTLEVVQKLVAMSRVVDVLASADAGSSDSAPYASGAPAAPPAGVGAPADPRVLTRLDPVNFGAGLMKDILVAEGGRGAAPAPALAIPVADGVGGDGSAVTHVPPAGHDYLYLRGAPATYLCVVLEGTLEVTAGADAIVSRVGPWDVLGERAFLALSALPAGTGAADAGNITYAPDFSARAVSPVVRVLRISREDYMAARAGTLGWTAVPVPGASPAAGGAGRLLRATPAVAGFRAGGAPPSAAAPAAGVAVSLQADAVAVAVDAARPAEAVGNVLSSIRPPAGGASGSSLEQEWAGGHVTNLPPTPEGPLADAVFAGAASEHSGKSRLLD